MVCCDLPTKCISGKMKMFQRVEPAMNERKFPIGIADFHSIRTGGYYYVDKTPHIERLIDQGQYYFLSRPRRFGKSLLLDTMRELFEGREELFRGLHIHDRWDWEKQYPVVRFSFNADYGKPGVLEKNVRAQLEALEIKHGLSDVYDSTNLQEPDRFGRLLLNLQIKTGVQVVVLIDEYDKPILDAIEDTELATGNRNYLRGLYGMIKGFDAQIRFVFLTGITMFSKLTLFSALNNLNDISLSPRYSSICGYTESDLDEVFAAEMEGLDRDEIRRWYNGYSWRGQDKVYNPWPILNLLGEREFKAYWSYTGMPSFLYKLMIEREFTPLDANDLNVNESFITTFDVDDIGAEALMFQSGYLTITGEHRDGFEAVYDLDYPNYEVRGSLARGYLNSLFGPGKATPRESGQLAGLLEANDFEGFASAFRRLLSAIPYEWHNKTDMARREGWYCSILHACLWDVTDTSVRSEQSHSRGRSDLVLLMGDQVFIFECKMLSDDCDADDMAGRAIMQIRDKGYADRYRDGVKTIHLIGAVFGGDERNLASMKVERA